MSWLCVFLHVSTSPRRIGVHSPRACANAGFLHKDLFAQLALFDGGTPTSLVIPPNGWDKWVSLVAAVPGAEVTDIGKQRVWGPWDVSQSHRMADSARDCPFRRSKQQVVPDDAELAHEVRVAGSTSHGCIRTSPCAAIPYLGKKSGNKNNVEDMR